MSGLSILFLVLFVLSFVTSETLKFIEDYDPSGSSSILNKIKSVGVVVIPVATLTGILSGLAMVYTVYAPGDLFF
jgi:hypothetical protein